MIATCVKAFFGVVFLEPLSIQCLCSMPPSPPSAASSTGRNRAARSCCSIVSFGSDGRVELPSRRCSSPADRHSRKINVSNIEICFLRNDGDALLADRIDVPLIVPSPSSFAVVNHL
ncbi:unnamed protein product [Soboliphyme baturini]|uniref:Secreted protein n=1 Tax=Soboliphyme baturini TaxID=241478 RepID=A0A183IMX2_9BILA|nr:unnamed protein product [Soboliphyme baturini]